jgi:hypothetical protein
LQSLQEEEDRFKAYVPKTRLTPQEYRAKGLRQLPIFDPPSSQQGEPLPAAGTASRRGVGVGGAFQQSSNEQTSQQGYQTSSQSNQYLPQRGQSSKKHYNIISHDEVETSTKPELAVAWGGAGQWTENMSPYQQQPTPQSQQQYQHQPPQPQDGWAEQPTPQYQQRYQHQQPSQDGWMDQPTPPSQQRYQQQPQDGWMDQPTPQSQQQYQQQQPQDGWMDQPTSQSQQQYQQQQQPQDGWIDQPTPQSQQQNQQQQPQVGWVDQPTPQGQQDDHQDVMNESPSKKWSDKVDKFIHTHLSLRIAMSLIALKASFQAASSVHEAKRIERKIRGEVDVLDCRSRLLTLFETAFQNPALYCRYGEGHIRESIHDGSGGITSSNHQMNGNMRHNILAHDEHVPNTQQQQQSSYHQSQYQQPPRQPTHHNQHQSLSQPQAQQVASRPTVNVPRLDLTGIRPPDNCSRRRMVGPPSSASTVSLAWD